MSLMRTGTVVRGCIDVPDPAGVGEQRRVNALNPGFGARNYKNLRRYRPGGTIELPSGEAERLSRAGLLVLVPAPSAE
jgi:hypothetical protein